MSQTPLVGSTVTAQKIPYSAFPCTEPRAIRFVADFAAVDTYSVDLNNAIELKQIDGIQSLWVDNVGNAQPVDFTFSGSNQRLRVPAGVQGYFPVLAPNPASFIVSSSGAVAINFQVLNFPVPSNYWPQ